MTLVAIEQRSPKPAAEIVTLPAYRPDNRCITPISTLLPKTGRKRSRSRALVFNFQYERNHDVLKF